MTKQKKKQDVNNKFNFDDEYIIGVSNSAQSPKKDGIKKKQGTNKNKKTNKTNKKTNKKINNKAVSKKTPQMNEKKRKLKGNVVKIFAIVCLFVGAGCFLCLSPMFNAQEIIVENNNLINADTIRSISKIKLYKNIFLIDKSDTIKNIEENPYVNSVKISRVFPNKIKISVEERVEKYLIEFAEGKYAIIDGQGYILDTTSEPKELPVLIGNKTSIEDLVKVEKNNQNRLNQEDLVKLDIVSEIIEISKNYEVDSFITKIDISDKNNITLRLDGEEKIVYLGSCNDLNTRILYMKEIINSEKGKRGEIFINGNLSSERVYFRESV